MARKRKALPDADTLRARAERKVVRKTGFLWLAYNLGAYVFVNAILIAIWALTDSESPWFMWVLAVWGLGLAFHIAGYIIGFRYGHSRERMIEEQVERYRGQHEEPTPPPTQPENAETGSDPGA